MEHQKYKEQIELLFYHELDEREQQDVEAHIQSCKECSSIFDELEKLHGVLAHYQPMVASDRLLNEARTGLRSALSDNRTKQSLTERIAGWLGQAMAPPVKLAFGGVATIALGVLIGYAVFRVPPAAPPQANQPILQPASNVEPPLLPEGGQITNVKFIDSDTRGGNVDFTFDAIMPMHLKGKVNDPQIQQVLSYALLNEQNPGVRLQSVSAMGSEQLGGKDEDVKHVLISAMRSDNNPGVRKEALNALQRFPFDDEIKRAFMDALVHDGNSAIRIAAINALDAAKTKGAPTDRDLMNILKDKMKSDENPYIRIRAKAALQEISNDAQ